MAVGNSSMFFNLFGRDVTAGLTLEKVGAKAEAAGLTASKALAGIGVAGAVGIGESVKLAADFQSNMTRLVTAAGEAPAKLGMVSKGVMAISSATGQTSLDLSKGLYQIESAGYHGAAGLSVLKATAQGAKVEGADLTSVGDALTTVLNDIPPKARDAADVMSKMVAAVGAGKMTMNDLSGSIHSVLPNASALHISLGQVLGALATMTAQGISADQAAQNLNHTIVKLAAPTQGMTTAMASYGLSAADVAKNLGTRGLTGTMELLSQAILNKMGPAGTTLRSAFLNSSQATQDLNREFKNLGPEAQALVGKFNAGTMGVKDFRKAAGELGGTQSILALQWLQSAIRAKGFSEALKSGGQDAQTFTAAMKSMLGDQTGLQVALHLTGDNMETFQNNVKTISGATKDASGNVRDWSIVSGTLNTKLSMLKASVENAGISIGTQLIPPLTSAAGFFAKHVTMTQNLAKLLILLATSFGIAALATKAWAVASGIYTAATALMTADTVAFDAALDANPIVIIGFAIAGLIVAVVELAKHWRGLVTAAVDTWRGLETAWRAVTSALTTAWHAVWTAMQAVWQSVGQPVFNFIKAYITGVGKVMSAIWSALVVAWRVTWTAIKLGWDTIGQPLFEIIKGVIDVFVVFAKVAFYVFVALVAAAWYLIKGLWDTVLHPVFNAIAAVIRWLVNNVAQPMLSALGKFFSTVWSGIKAVWSAVGAPVMRAVGSGIQAGVAIGKAALSALSSTFHAVANFMGQVFNATIRPLANAFGSVFGSIKSFVLSAVGAVSSAWSGMWNNMTSVVSGVWGSIKGILNGIISGINSFISILDNVSISIPKIHLPGTNVDVGGGSVGFSIPHIPSLALGATVLPKPGGTLVRVAEAGKPESVVDTGLLNRTMERLLDATAGQKMAQSQPTQITVILQADGRELARTVQEYNGKVSGRR